jgi:hypothetical protein
LRCATASSRCIELALCDGVEPLYRFARAREKGIHFHKVAVEMRHRLQLS